MRKSRTLFLAFILTTAATAFAAAPPQPAATAAAPLTSGWVEIKEGEATGTFEADAKTSANPDPHLLKISVTHYADAGKGRYGVKNTANISTQDGAHYDIAFTGASEGIGVGLVFSLETDDGKVIARTTLPEIGRGMNGGGRGGRAGGRGAAAGPTTAPALPWRNYLVSLTARSTVPNAHLTITPIEQVPVWIQNLTVTQRPAQ